MTESNYEIKQINEKLVGGTIVGTIKDDGEGFGFEVSKDDVNVLVWVDRDPENNGPGHLEIEVKP
jgi:hypothetical protein